MPDLSLCFALGVVTAAASRGLHRLRSNTVSTFARRRLLRRWATLILLPTALLPPVWMLWRSGFELNVWSAACVLSLFGLHHGGGLSDMSDYSFSQSSTEKNGGIV